MIRAMPDVGIVREHGFHDVERFVEGDHGHPRTVNAHVLAQVGERFLIQICRSKMVGFTRH